MRAEALPGAGGRLFGSYRAISIDEPESSVIHRVRRQRPLVSCQVSPAAYIVLQWSQHTDGYRPSQHTDGYRPSQHSDRYRPSQHTDGYRPSQHTDGTVRLFYLLNFKLYIHFIAQRLAGPIAARPAIPIRSSFLSHLLRSDSGVSCRRGGPSGVLASPPLARRHNCLVARQRRQLRVCAVTDTIRRTISRARWHTVRQMAVYGASSLLSYNYCTASDLLISVTLVIHKPRQNRPTCSYSISTAGLIEGAPL